MTSHFSDADAGKSAPVASTGVSHTGVAHAGAVHAGVGHREHEILLATPSAEELAAARADVDLLRLHAEYCKVVANEHRLAILYALAEKERSVGDLAHELGLTLANVSQHLRVMKARGLVSSRRDGRTIFYSVANAKLVTACHLIREALVEQHLINEAIILGDGLGEEQSHDDHRATTRGDTP